MSKMTPEFFEGVMWAVNQLTADGDECMRDAEAFLGKDSFASITQSNFGKAQLNAASFILTKTKEANGWQPPEKLPTL